MDGISHREKSKLASWRSGISSSPPIEECLTLQNIVTTTCEFHIHVPSPRLHVVLIVSMLSYFVNV